MLFAALKDNLLNYYRKRTLIAFICFCFFAAIIFTRLFILQVIEYEELSGEANNNRISKRDIIADRGFIYDTNMNILVSNTPSYDLVLSKDEIRGKSKEEINKMLQDAASVIPVDLDAVEKGLKDKNVDTVLISRGLTLSDIPYFEEYSDNFAGLSVELHSVRKYIDGMAFSHILGYVSEATREDILKNRQIYKQGSLIGSTGVELQYEKELRGRAGVREIERDARGRTVNILSEIPAVSGNDLILTIDSALQKYVANVMEGKKGAVVVLDISDNSLLSLYSAPSYDLNKFTPYVDIEEWRKINRDIRSPLINRTIEGLYAPGSVYKVAMALAGLEEKVIDKNTVVDCHGVYHYSSAFSYRCWKKTGHGKVNLQKALAESCDVYFYQLGLKLDIDRMEYYSKILSLGEITGIDLPNEKSGLYPSRDWKSRRTGSKDTKWYPGDTINTSIGQGFVISTPLQIAVMMSGIFNGGKIYKPRIVRSVLNSQNGKFMDIEPELKHQIDVTPEIRQIIMRGLVDAVYKVGGTSRRAALDTVKVGGKTGTAQVVSLKVTDKYKGQEIPEEHRDHAWFTGVFPAKNPQYVIVVLAENSGGGGVAAAPIAGRIINEMYDMGYIKNN